MGSPAARITDQTMHGGVIVVGCPTVLIGKKPAARVGDNHTCPMASGPVPHVGGPLVMGAWTVLVGGPPVSRIGDMLVCVGPPDSVMLGESTVLVGMAGGAGFGAIMMGLMAGLANFAGGYPRAVLDPNGNIVTQYNSQVTIQGSPEYQAAVVADLNRFTATPTGQAWLEAYGRTGRNITIRPIPPGDEQNNGGATRVSPNDALIHRNPNGTETRGAGSDTIVDYNPSYTAHYRGEDGNTYESQPHETLGHELIHGLHNANGENRREIPDTGPNGDNQEEARTIGVHGYEGEDISERRLSEDERGPGSARPDHNASVSDTFQDENGVWHETTYDATGNANDTVIPAPAGGLPNH
jgi:uncharacterized Zn-binding protein involved in type VI secretion